MQRLSDAKLLAGWVVSMSELEIVVRFIDTEGVRNDDSIFVQAYGNGVVGQFTGRVVSCRSQMVTMVLVTGIKALPTQEAYRLKTDLILGELNANGFRMDFQIVDVSEKSLGVVTKLPLVKGATVQVQIDDCGNKIESNAVVKYCRPLNDGSGQFRAGLAFKDIDKVQWARWSRLVENVAAA